MKVCVETGSENYPTAVYTLFSKLRQEVKREFLAELTTGTKLRKAGIFSCWIVFCSG